MKAMLTAFAAILLIAIAANIVLGQLGFTSQQRAAGPDVRLGQAPE